MNKIKIRYDSHICNRTFPKIQYCLPVEKQVKSKNPYNGYIPKRIVLNFDSKEQAEKLEAKLWASPDKWFEIEEIK
jgi:hypothetical protein